MPEDFHCKFEDRILKLCEDAAGTRSDVKNISIRINGALDDIADHVRHGRGWRSAIFGLAITVIINIIVFSNIFGKIQAKVEGLESHVSQIHNYYYDSNGDLKPVSKSD